MSECRSSLTDRETFSRLFLFVCFEMRFEQDRANARKQIERTRGTFPPRIRFPREVTWEETRGYRSGAIYASEYPRIFYHGDARYSRLFSHDSFDRKIGLPEASRAAINTSGKKETVTHVPSFSFPIERTLRFAV